MIQVTVQCDKPGCSESSQANVRNANEIFKLLARTGFDFVTRPDEKKEILLCKKCRDALAGVETDIETARKVAYGEFFEGSKG